MQTLPLYLPLLFGATALLTTWLLYRATRLPRIYWAALALLLVFQSALALSGFYTVTDTLPSRMVLALFPSLAAAGWLLLSAKGKRLTEGVATGSLLLLFVVRVPVEIVLYLLYRQGQVPELMTFSGRNFDLLAGLTAPLVCYFYAVRKTLPARWALAWNLLSLGLLLNILVNALLALPTPFQQWGFERPNVAVLYFPYILLPAFIVPVVLWAHLVLIRRLAAGLFKPRRQDCFGRSTQARKHQHRIRASQ